ncbi:MAG: CHAT domain-containing protein [Pseudomonadota bacterium]
MVSHWPVFDDIASLLTVGALEGAQAGRPRAEALQAGMRAIRQDPDLDATHLAVWAPFSLVGEGR